MGCASLSHDAFGGNGLGRGKGDAVFVHHVMREIAFFCLTHTGNAEVLFAVDIFKI